jgi:hypothetical protein
MKMRLFDDAARSDRRPKCPGEDSFAFLNRVDTPFWKAVRTLLEEWFERYPDSHRAELRDAYRSPLAGRHFGAWWELYLHELFLRLGYEIEVHPALSGTERCPDFRLRNGSRSLLVEAAAVFSGISTKGEPSGDAPEWMTAAVESLRSPDFFVGYDEVIAEGREQLRRTQITGPLQEWLDGLDPDEERAKMEVSGELPHFLVSCRGWEVSFEAWAVAPEQRGRPDHRVLGSGPAMGGPVNDIEQLLGKLKAKAGRYGRPQEPFVIAVLCLSAFMERLDIEQALFGREAVVIEGPGAGRLVRQPNGLWFHRGSPVNRRVSAVLTAVCVQPWTVGKIAPELWLNPWAEHELEESWPFTVASAKDSGEITRTERSPAMAEIFELPSEWPPGKPFPRD